MAFQIERQKFSTKLNNEKERERGIFIYKKLHVLDSGNRSNDKIIIIKIKKK